MSDKYVKYWDQHIGGKTNNGYKKLCEKILLIIFCENKEFCLFVKMSLVIGYEFLELETKLGVYVLCHTFNE